MMSTPAAWRSCMLAWDKIKKQVFRYSGIQVFRTMPPFHATGCPAGEGASKMKERPLRTTGIGSYPVPGWLAFACQNLDQFGPADRAELQEDAVIAAIHDQVAAGLDVITDGEQSRLDFNLSFYGFLEGIERE